MLLRSSTQLPVASHTSVKTGDFIELRTCESVSRPWLARIVAERHVLQEDGQLVNEIDCEWLWHPQDAIVELELTDVEPEFYGSREFFLTDETCESVRDWNLLETVKWQVYVFPLPEYKKLVSNRYRIPSPENASQTLILDPSRCWYYRQKCHPEKRLLIPPLDLTIHCPNPAFLEWCKTVGVSPEVPTPLNLPPEATNPPRRSLCIPENPERLYFLCSVCMRRFETPQGDCLVPSRPFSQDTQEGDVLTSSRFKSSINQPDITFVCPMCNYGRTVSTTGSNKSTEVANKSLETPIQPRILQVRQETDRKATRYERFHQVFQKALEECHDQGDESTPERYTDSHVLCSDFFQRFDQFAERERLSSKMIHQKLHEIFQNLKRDNNSALRHRIVMKTLSLDDLLDLDAKELAPESVKRRREMEAQQYFKQQVLLDNPHQDERDVGVKLIRKTHKGLEPIQDDSEPFFLSHTTQPSETHPSFGMEKKEAHHSAMGSWNVKDSKTSIKEIMKQVQNRANKDLNQTKLFFLTQSLHTLWKTQPLPPEALELSCPSEFTGIPSRQQTIDFLENYLKEIPGGSRIVEPLKHHVP